MIQMMGMMMSGGTPNQGNPFQAMQSNFASRQTPFQPSNDGARESLGSHSEISIKSITINTIDSDALNSQNNN